MVLSPLHTTFVRCARRLFVPMAAVVALGCGAGRGFVDAGTPDAGTLDGTTPFDATHDTGVDVLSTDAPVADGLTPSDGAADGGADAGPMCSGSGADPYASLTTPGDYTDPPGCGTPPCPAPFDSFTVTPNSTGSVAQVSGHVSGVGTCSFVVDNAACGVETGTLGIEPDSGVFSGPVPLFCGTNLVKIICSAGTNRRIHVVSVPGAACSGDDLRLTLTWDDHVVDGELHLIRSPGPINNSSNDCTWTTCLPGNVLDWGVIGDTTDNPVKDVDNTSTNGTEHITLQRAPAGTYYVMAEHWNPGGQPGMMSMQVNVQGRSPIVQSTPSIAAHWVWYVGSITFPGGVFTASDTMASPPHTPPLTDCTGANWTSPGCSLPIPQ